ncbi:Bro-N domain-containing protein [Bilophila wadsworthia]|uniref:BRO-N domain-containing protein n=1 Tax=Bilophila wadsworthia TaxID=35833 RepID=UPI0028E362FF|nr:BRO family protein [Bilophila wadsworthia]
MTTFLCFNDFTFSPVTRDNQPWFKSSEIARALGYKREDFLSKLYRKNADEFTPDMTQVVENRAERRNGVPGNLSDGRVRIFSLRGCHLLAMFARTPVAKAFRKWCLDVIEQYGDRVPVAEPVTLNDELISAAERAELKLIVDAKLSTYPAAVQGKARAEIWAKFNRHFRIAEYKQLPTRLMPDAREFLLSVSVRAINAIPTAEAAIPPTPPRFDETPFLRLAEDIRRFQQTYRRSYQLFFGRLYQLGTPVLVQLEQRAALGQGTAPFSDMTIRGQFDRFLSERLLESLSSLAELLPDRHNPAMLLLACARSMSAR